MSSNGNKHNQLSRRLQNITPSLTLATDTKAKAMLEEGEDVCSFGAGEPDFDTPEFIKEACLKALMEGKTKYIASAGLKPLKAAVAEKYREFNKVSGVKDTQVIISPGGKFSCYLAIAATCNPGDEVLIPSPYWVSYPEMVKLVEAKPKILLTQSKTEFKVFPEQLKDAINPKTRLFILNSPSNPTGTVYTQKEIEALVEVALAHNIFILSDEIYEHLLYDSYKHFSPASMGSEALESIITISGFSKSYSMTGWRLGTLMAAEKITRAIAKLQGHTTSCATSFAQYGALAALENKETAAKAIKAMLTIFNKRRIKLHEGLINIKGISCMQAHGAFYLFPKISNFGLSSIEFSSKLLDEEKVATVPGIAFGADECIRLSYATSDRTIERGIERLKRFCDRLRSS